MKAALTWSGGRALGRLLAGYVERLATRAPLRVVSATEDLADDHSCAGLAERLLRDASRGHVAVPFWSTDQLCIGLLAAARFGTRPFLERYEVVADDSFGGAIMQGMGERLRLHMRPIHTRGNPERLRDVGTWLRDPAPFLIAVDGGATYGSIPTGIIRLAARLRSVLWPIAIRARPVVRVPGLIAALPLPGASLAVGVADPLVITRQMAVAEAARALKERLDWAVDAADESLRAGSRSHASSARSVILGERV